MDLVQVDIVGAQPAQAVFGGLPHVLRLGAVVRFVELHAELGGDDDSCRRLPSARPRIFLAVAFIVDVGGIEEVDAGVERGVDHAARLRFIDAPAEIVAA